MSNRKKGIELQEDAKRKQRGSQRRTLLVILRERKRREKRKKGEDVKQISSVGLISRRISNFNRSRTMI